MLSVMCCYITLYDIVFVMIVKYTVSDSEKMPIDASYGELKFGLNRSFIFSTFLENILQNVSNSLLSVLGEDGKGRSICINLFFLILKPLL